jgi:hypothetical protein
MGEEMEFEVTIIIVFEMFPYCRDKRKLTNELFIFPEHLDSKVTQ